MIVAAALISILVLGAPVASAAVQVDPHGPAGQQYALPLDSVRGEVSGDPSVGVPGAEAPAPLFGQGIRPKNERDRKKTDDDKLNGQRKKTRPGQPAGGSNLKTSKELSALVNGTGGGTSGLLQIGLLVGGMALVGITAGLIGRRTL